MPETPAVRPRISFVVDSDAWGGAEVYTTHLLRRAADNGWLPSLVCSEPVSSGFTDLLPAHRVGVVALARHSQQASQVLAALARQRPDVVHINLVDPASNLAAMRAAQSTAPTVATLHLPGGVGDEPCRDQLRRSYGHLHGALTPSRQGRHQLVTDLGMPGDRVVVIHNGVDIPSAPSGPAGRRPPRVGAVGRLTAQKGFDVLLGSVRALRGQGYDFDLVIAGAGRDADRLAEQARGLPVSFAGFVSDVPALLADLDVFCLPSRTETFPLALLEAMAAGLPCVATDVGDVGSGVGGAALVVPPQDEAALTAALASLLGDVELRRKQGHRARAHAVAYLSADRMASRTFAAVRALAGTAADPRPSRSPRPA